MKAVILAGGYGTRISEESHNKPKPMILIGGKPILWHIMKIYSSHGVNDFIICCGYKGYMIKEYFSNYFLHTSDITFDLSDNSIEFHNKRSESWKVTLVDTGEATMTGGRIKRIQDYVRNEKSFFLTYGDGVSNVDISKLHEFHLLHCKKATVTAVTPPGRFGVLDITTENQVKNFKEKPSGDLGRINGGFFVLSPEIIDLIDDDKTIFEGQPLEDLAKEGELMSFNHNDFWQPMDTLRDMQKLEDLWNSGNAPWKTW
tara:strand:- start:950 stop:1723 length:774 start_codon:yes stop_codon:yes gene_type:complete